MSKISKKRPIIDLDTLARYVFDIYSCSCGQQNLDCTLSIVPKKSRSSLLLSHANSDLCRTAPLSALVRRAMHRRQRSCAQSSYKVAPAVHCRWSARQHNNFEGAWRALKSRATKNGNRVPGAARFLRLVNHATEDTRARLGHDQCLAEPCARGATVRSRCIARLEHAK